MQIAAGYEDANDCNFLKNDGIIKLCSLSDKPLATQPTMCRMENQPKSTELYEMAKVFVDHFISSHTSAPKFIIIDCDDTNSCQYKAGTWEYSQRVVVKVEANSFGTNIRYITSNLKVVRTKALYELGYCARGAASELRIKEHKTYLLLDQMSCNRFMANQFRLFLFSCIRFDPYPSNGNAKRNKVL